uniref:Uncharacterized protein n=1 Tax=Setaria italica TaxID=4555 RepID=K4A4B5_SETIT
MNHEFVVDRKNLERFNLSWSLAIHGLKMRCFNQEKRGVYLVVKTY